MWCGLTQHKDHRLKFHASGRALPEKNGAVAKPMLWLIVPALAMDGDMGAKSSVLSVTPLPHMNQSKHPTCLPQPRRTITRHAARPALGEEVGDCQACICLTCASPAASACFSIHIFSKPLPTSRVSTNSSEPRSEGEPVLKKLQGAIAFGEKSATTYVADHRGLSKDVHHLWMLRKSGLVQRLCVRSNSLL